MKRFSRRNLLRTAGAATAVLAGNSLAPVMSPLLADKPARDSLPMQLYRSLNDEQRRLICLPADHKSRQFISNWWYIHREHRIDNTFQKEQQDLIQQIFDSLHNPDYREAVNRQVKVDQYDQARNTPAVGFFGTPADDDFEFIYTGHHVTRRCNAHTDTGMGFGGAPIFYGHFPTDFNETKDHPGNPYWYQGLIFNEFVEALDGKQQRLGLVSKEPRSEKPDAVIRMQKSGPGLSCADLSADQKELLIKSMGRMLAIFRDDDVKATVKAIKDRNVVDQLHVSWYDGKYDIGNDEVWDTWQIEGPEMVWYFRGQPHIHSYFHLKS